MKRLWQVLIVIGISVLSLYLITIFIIIPRTASMLLPSKWKQLSPGHQRVDYASYLGRPAEVNDNTDTWIVEKDKYVYQLHLKYNKDNIAYIMEIKYSFNNFLFSRNAILIQDSAY